MDWDLNDSWILVSLWTATSASTWRPEWSMSATLTCAKQFDNVVFDANVGAKKVGDLLLVNI